MKPIDRLLEFATAPHVLPAKVWADTERLLADTLAVGAAGATAPFADAVLRTARGWGDGREARTIGADERLTTANAAFVNGFRIHCLEWDCVHEPGLVHAMSVVTAVLGAVTDKHRELTPDDLLVAVAVGVEIAAGLGDSATSPLTFFRPATTGCLGAALAAARVTGAPAASALGLAYSFCAGTMQAHVEGSIALPLQIANAAQAAVMAEELAMQGLVGPRDVLDGPFGYFALFDRGDTESLVAELGTRWRISEVSTKPYPCGRASHGLLSGIAELSLSTEETISVTLHAPPLVKRLVGRPMRPDMSTAYARLCGPFLGALMLIDGRIDPRRFVDESFADEGIAKLAARIRIDDNGSSELNALSPQRLLVETITGRTELELEHTLGSPQAPLTPTQAAAKSSLAAELALPECDPRIFAEPVAYLTEAA